MAATDQEILDSARDALKRILDADISSFGEGGHSAKMLEIDRLQNLISQYERRTDTGPVFKPIREVNL